MESGVQKLPIPYLELAPLPSPGEVGWGEAEVVEVDRDSLLLQLPHHVRGCEAIDVGLRGRPQHVEGRGLILRVTVGEARDVLGGQNCQQLKPVTCAKDGEGVSSL